MDNKRDEGGFPICPLCGESITTGQSVVRRGNTMAHVHCAEAEREREKSEPTA